MISISHHAQSFDHWCWQMTMIAGSTCDEELHHWCLCCINDADCRNENWDSTIAAALNQWGAVHQLCCRCVIDAIAVHLRLLCNIWLCATLNCDRCWSMMIDDDLWRSMLIDYGRRWDDDMLRSTLIDGERWYWCVYVYMCSDQHMTNEICWDKHMIYDMI